MKRKRKRGKTPRVTRGSKRWREEVRCDDCERVQGDRSTWVHGHEDLAAIGCRYCGCLTATYAHPA